MRRMELRMTPLLAVLVLGVLVSDRGGVCAMTLLAALLHECGHLVAARLMRIPLGQMRVDLMGARLEVRGRMLTYGEEWLLSAAGPMISLLAAAAGALLWERWSAAKAFSCASLILGFLNLLPIRSFDGGRMLECTLSRFLSTRALRDVMRVLSFLFLCILWMVAVYFLLRAGSGLSLFCFSMSLLTRFFDENEDA
ncbi:MAG: site-2 protease family protein [Clostridia bacterium]|nr:site-2 protease family protein [Clostridia bacterium]